MSSPFDGLKLLTLQTLGNGASEELFQHELSKVIANIADPNTDQGKKRMLVMNVTFATVDGSRDVVAHKVEFTSKLAGLKPATAMSYLVEQDGKARFVGRDIRQVDAFEEPVDPSVRPISGRAAGDGKP